MFKASELLNPINETQACGEEILFAPEIDVIVEARRSEDATLSQGEWVTDIKTASWPVVIENCVSLLTNKSKDLRFAVWLTEAGVKTDHFAGLAEGFQLISGLFNIYWDNFYPPHDESDGHEQRIGNLSWLLTQSLTLIKEVPITEGRNTAFSVLDFEIARRNNANTTEDQDRGEIDEQRSLEALEKAKRKSSRKHYQTLLSDIQYCQASLVSLEKAVDDRLGVEGPSFSPVKESLDLVMDTVIRFAKEVGINMGTQESATNNPASNQPLEESAAPIQNTAEARTFSSQIQNRTDALLQLRKVADFFRETEPHSPVAYLADKAADWGDMPLHDWLNTVIKDTGSLSHVEELLGIVQKNDEASE